MYEDVECPYCGKEQDINHDDGYGYEEGVKHQQDCPYCHKTFVYTTEISFYYEAEKADCLNGGEHEWEITDTCPNMYSRMRCKACDEKRKLTEEECKIYGIRPDKPFLRQLETE